MDNVKTRSGVVAIIGKPNSGKSTLLNSILGVRLSIVTPKPQTTRKRILGIYTTGDTQIAFVDTPGILKPKYEMHESMLDYIREAVKDADAICAIIDAAKYKSPSACFSDEFLTILNQVRKPKILVINKIDLLKDVKYVLPIIAEFNKTGTFDEYIATCAVKGTNVDVFIDTMKKYIPEGNFLYDEEDLSTMPQRFFVSEMIREAVFYIFREEIPYSTEVLITDFRERETGKWYISADILVEKESQKKIIIGSHASMLKKIGEKARLEIESYLDEEVYLELFVKVRNNWRNNPSILRQLGY